MRSFLFTVLVFAALLPTNVVRATDGSAVDTAKVISLTQFLEDHPLDKQAPTVRAALVQWEARSTDVVDVVCPGVFAPVPAKSVKYSGELLGQFILGSAVHQLAVPADKGKLMPLQLAGVSSMLKAYRAILATDKSARIARFDSLSRDQAAGSLATTIEPLVISNCLPKPVSKSRFPWTLGMSKTQILALKGYGPYRSFSNGDLETYNGVFDGHFENFQFFFDRDQLRRISISTYEGNDLTAASLAWGRLYESMHRTFGTIETPKNQVIFKSGSDSMRAFEASARRLVENGDKAQMAPKQEPDDASSFASFSEHEVQGTMIYYVSLYFDPLSAVGKAALGGIDPRL